MAEQAKATAKKAAPKAAAKKTAARKPAAKKTAARKPAPKKKVAAKKAAPKLGGQLQENGRKVFLASLGFYGKLFDEAESRMEENRKRIEQNRKKADKLYSELVKRGEKVEKTAKKSIDELDLPKLPEFDLDIEEQLEKAKARFEELRGQVSFKKAA
jgi:hypothetical protein